MRLVVAALILWTSTAYAQAPEPPTRSDRYGTTIAIVDGISVGVLAGGIAMTAI